MVIKKYQYNCFTSRNSYKLVKQTAIDHDSMGDDNEQETIY